MWRVTAWLVVALVAGGAVPAGAADLAKVDRSIGKEPPYQTKTPRYGLLVFGPAAQTRVWVVYDGAGLYADGKGDGNLSADERSNVFGAGFKPFEVADVAGPDRYLVRFMQMCLADNSPPKLYVEVEVKGKFQQCGIATFDERSQKRETAPVAHFNGPLAMKIHRQGGAKLSGGAKPVELVAVVGTFDDTFGCSVAVLNQVLAPAPGKEGFVVKDFRAETVAKAIDKGYLVRKDFPEGVHPVADIEFPTKRPGGEPLREPFELRGRC